jgi:hypothetical protein
MSRARNLSGLMGTSATLDVNDIADAADLSGVEIYEDSDAQAAAVYIPGRQIYRRDLGAFQIHNGSSWRTIDFTASNPYVWSFQGDIAGYALSGYVSGTSAAGTSNQIEKSSFASDGNSVSVGTMGTRGETKGYSSSIAGYGGVGFTYPPDTFYNDIVKHLFASEGSVTSVGSILVHFANFATLSSELAGYTTGGNNSPEQRNIQKFPFATETSSQVGLTTQVIMAPLTWSTSAYGYIVGGNIAPGGRTDVSKFSYVSDGNDTNIGTLSPSISYGSGASDGTIGYAIGYGPIYSWNISTESTTVLVGNLTDAREKHRSWASTTAAYTTGGSFGATMKNIIDKFPFASAANATDVGDLTQAKKNFAETQN